MTSYSDWDRISVPLFSIDLDAENPRFDSVPESQNEIVDILLGKEFKLLDLVHSIFTRGFTPLDNIIVYEDQNSGSYVVLEGNRRIAALKLLLNPALARNDALEKKLNKWSAQLQEDQKKELSQLEVVVAPSRRSADKLLLSRHTMTPIESWSPVMQAKFVYERANAIGFGKASQDLAIPPDELQKFIHRYHYYNLAKHYLGDEFDHKKLPVTNLERLLQASDVKEYLGIEDGEHGKLSITSGKEEFKKSFGTIIDAVVNKDIDSRAINKADDATAWVKQNIKRPQASQQKTPFDKLYAKPSLKSRAQPDDKPRPSNRLFPNDLGCPDNNSRLGTITNELKKLNLNTCPNAVAVLYRTFLEIACWRYIEYKDLVSEYRKHQNAGGNRAKGELSNALGFLSNQNNNALPGNLAKAVAQFSSKGFFTLRTLHEYTHNAEMVVTPKDLRDFWGQTEGFVRHIMKRGD